MSGGEGLGGFTKNDFFGGGRTKILVGRKKILDAWGFWKIPELTTVCHDTNGFDVSEVSGIILGRRPT